jgi:hypothetical protein
MERQRFRSLAPRLGPLLSYPKGRTESSKAVRSIRTPNLALVTTLELLAELIQIRKGQFSGVRSITNSEIDHLVHEQITIQTTWSRQLRAVYKPEYIDGRAHWIANFPLSMEQAGSLLSVIRRQSSLDCCFCSTRSFSVCRQARTPVSSRCSDMFSKGDYRFVVHARCQRKAIRNPKDHGRSDHCCKLLFYDLGASSRSESREMSVRWIRALRVVID